MVHGDAQPRRKVARRQTFHHLRRLHTPRGRRGAAAYFGFKYLGNSLKSSEAYQAAEAALRSSPTAAERLGEIESTGFPIGTYSDEPSGSGNAVFTISVEGTKASARYVATLERRGGTWYVTTPYYTADNEIVPISRGGREH